MIDPVADRSDPLGSPIVPLTVVAAGPDRGNVTFAAVGFPSGLTIDPATGVVTGTPDTVDETTVTVTVTDDEAVSTEMVFGWTVFDPGPPPVDPRGCPTGATPFTDVSVSSLAFAFADIACIFGLGITTGRSATAHDAAGLVTREQVAAFMPASGDRRSRTGWPSDVPLPGNEHVFGCVSGGW